jgi:hypothetical protein
MKKTSGIKEEDVRMRDLVYEVILRDLKMNIKSLSDAQDTKHNVLQVPKYDSLEMSEEDLPENMSSRLS